PGSPPARLRLSPRAHSRAYADRDAASSARLDDRAVRRFGRVRNNGAGSRVRHGSAVARSAAGARGEKPLITLCIHYTLDPAPRAGGGGLSGRGDDGRLSRSENGE